ncbi:hypothetical protein DMENIID0001_167040 [Sergentomyia squamirostris]
MPAEHVVPYYSREQNAMQVLQDAEMPVCSSNMPTPLSPSCEICCDRPARIHYRVFACRGCDSFFMRSNSVVDVTAQTRTHCKFCRLQKCLAAGMRITRRRGRDGKEEILRRNLVFRIPQQKKDSEEEKKAQETGSHVESIIEPDMERDAVSPIPNEDSNQNEISADFTRLYPSAAVPTSEQWSQFFEKVTDYLQENLNDNYCKQLFENADANYSG